MIHRDSRLLFTIGSQRSGKSTLARKWLNRELDLGGLVDDGHPRYLWDTDDLRWELYGKRYCRSGEPMAFAIKHYAIATALRSGHDVIVAGTHTSKTSIRRLLEIRQNAIPILVDTPVEICQQRAIATEQLDLLPVIERSCRQIEAIKLQGIDQVIRRIIDQITGENRLMVHWLDGKSLADQILIRVREESREFRQIVGRKPHLHIFCASADPASQVYIRKKIEVGRRVDIMVTTHIASDDESINPALWFTQRLDQILSGVPRQHEIDGMILQLPVNGVKDPRKLCALIPPHFDVDCLTPENLGLLSQGIARYPSCTPNGIIRLLDHNDIPIEGQRVLIVNDSLIVGRPLAMMMIDRGASVTICHHRSDPEDLKNYGLQADIIVVAVGKPNFLLPRMVNPGCVVIDVGITRLESSIVGDCHPDVAKVAGCLSPVPGGVGPLTVACLMENIILATKKQTNLVFSSPQS